MGRVILSGGAGFLPSHLCDRLLAEGHEVVAVDNFITGRRDNVAHLLDNPGFTLVEQDVSEPFTLDGGADYVMHMASPASPPDFKTIPFETMKAGSYGSHNMLELARQKGARFFLASTSEVYGDPPPEHHPQVEEYWGNVNPNGARSVYDEAKRYAEAVTMAYHREYDLEVRVVRIFNTYGPRMRPDDGRVVTNFITQALNNEPLTLYGDGSQTRSFTFVTDTADGIYRLLMSDESTPVNIGNPTEFTMRELAEQVIDLTGAQSAIVCLEQPFSDDPKQRKPNIAKAQRVLGWEPTIPLREGLQKTIEHVRSEIAVRPS
jgi:nucleoside-diphosphate-sugar epimerase